MDATRLAAGTTASQVSFEHGIVRTLSSGTPVASSLTIVGDTVLSLDEAPFEGPVTSRIDLGGRCVVPGFTDSHVHFLMWSMAQRQVRLESCRSVREVVDTVGRSIVDRAHDGWVIGHGWRPRDWDVFEQPTRHDLDECSGDVPIMLRSKDGHSVWLNSKALATANGDLAVPGGVVVTYDDGEPTGVLREESAWRFQDRHVVIDPIDYLDAVRDGVRIANARGITAIHDKDGGLGAIGIWQQLRDEGSLSLRVWQSFPAVQLPELSGLGLRSGLGDDVLRAGYLKAFMDGSLGSETAHRFDGSGVSITGREEFEDLIRRASRAGWPVAVHAIGDRANRDALDGFEATADTWGPRGFLPRIEHAQLVHPDDVPRFARIGVAASVQFTHATTDRDLVDGVWDDVAEHAYQFRALWDAGTLMANGSDAPITELDPLMGIRAAVARTTDQREGWHVEQALTPEQALMASTVNPARLSGDLGHRGQLLPGQLADLVVLDRDTRDVLPRRARGRSSAGYHARWPMGIGRPSLGLTPRDHHLQEDGWPRNAARNELEQTTCSPQERQGSAIVSSSSRWSHPGRREWRMHRRSSPGSRVIILRSSCGRSGRSCPHPHPVRTSLTFSRPHGPCERMDGFEAGRAIESGVRDIVVCTHGTRDPCCGTIGMQLVSELAAWAIEQPGVRLWRTSHLGGHRFAPTLVDLPSGDSWAFMDPSVALELLTGDPTPASVRRHHRGWWGLSSAFEQAAETEAWAVIGPLWRTGVRTGHIVATSHDGDLVQVRLGSAVPNGHVMTVIAEVRRALRPQMVSCGETRAEAEYTVTQLKVEAP